MKRILIALVVIALTIESCAPSVNLNRPPRRERRHRHMPPPPPDDRPYDRRY